MQRFTAVALTEVYEQVPSAVSLSLVQQTTSPVNTSRYQFLDKGKDQKENQQEEYNTLLQRPSC